MFPPPQLDDRRAVPRVARQVEAAEPLQRPDSTRAERPGEDTQRVVGLDRPAPKTSCALDEEIRLGLRSQVVTALHDRRFRTDAARSMKPPA